MTAQKAIFNVKQTLDGTVNSAIKAAGELAKIPPILQQFNSVTLGEKARIGTDDDLQNYIAQLGTLTQTEQNAANQLVSFKNGMGQVAQQYKEFIDKGEVLNSKLLEQTLSGTSLDEVNKKSLLTMSGLIDANGKYGLQLTNDATNAIKATKAYQNLTDAEKGEVDAAIAGTIAKQQQDAATKTLTASQTALNAVMAIGKQLMFAAVITGITYAIQELAQWLNNLKPNMQEMIDDGKAISDEYSNLKQTLEDYKKQLEELADKKALVREGKITDPDEIQDIETQNEYLKAQVKLYQELAAEKAKEANQKAFENANAKTHVSSASSGSTYAENGTSNDAGAGGIIKIDNTDYLKEQIAAYKDLNDQLNDLADSYANGGIEEKDFIAQSDELKSKMEAARGEINSTYQEISDNFNNAIDDGSDKFNQLKEKTDASTTAYMNFQNSVNGATEAQDSLNQAASNDRPWDVDTTQELADFMAKLSDSSSDLYAKTKALTSAYNDMYQNQKLSSDSIQSLISAYPELISQMETENGVTTISKDILCDKFEAMKSAMVATIESEIQATETAIAQANARIATYQAEIKAITALYSAIGSIDTNITVGTAAYEAEMEHLSGAEQKAFERYVSAQAGIKDANKTLEDATAKLKDQKNALDVLNNLTLPNYSGATKGASSANKGAAQAAKEHKKALEAQKKEAEKTQKALEKYSKTLKAQGDAVIDILDKRKDALEKEQKAKDKAWDKEKEQLQDEKDLKDKAWDKEKAALKEQKELQDDIYDKQKKALKEQKELQDKVYQQQIDDLKDKKQALQDANDEEDRAIKLAQLQDALEQARSQRTKRVYQHDTGFEWQTDDTAVSDAQNALDDQQRTWRREDAIAAVEKEIEAVEKLKDAYDEQVEAEIDGIDKAKDAYDEKIDTQIDAIEKAKDAFDEMIEDRIDQIENAKDAYDEMIEGETEKLDEMKEKWQEVMDLIGMSWEDYQAKIAATAQFQNMTLDGMGQYLGGYKDEVIKNMQDIAAAEAEVQRITDELSGLDTSSSSGGGGGGAGGSGVSTGGGQKSGYAGLSDNLKKVADTMSENIAKLNDLKAREEELTEQIDTGNLSTQEKTDKYRELGDVQQQITDKEADLNQMSLNYIETLGNETEATDEYRASAVGYLQELDTQYGASYDEILEKLQKHVEDLKDTDTGTAEVYDSMGKTVQEFSKQVSDYISGPAGLTNDFEKLQEQVQKTADAIVETCDKAVQSLKTMKESGKGSGAGSSAIGSRSIQRAGYYHIDESGPEIVVHDGKPGSGRYTYMERGGEILPASFSKNLWDIGSNPGEWFERQYSKFNRMDNSKATYAGGSTVYSPTFTGDIVISNPIANSDDLARGLKQNLPASFMQAVGVRM